MKEEEEDEIFLAVRIAASSFSSSNPALVIVVHAYTVYGTYTRYAYIPFVVRQTVKERP